MKTTAISAAFLILLAAPALSATVSQTYSYFRIGGASLEEIERELQRRGPQVGASGSRHPGATRMEFTTRITYGERRGFCSVVKATVAVKANMILPRWSRPRGADRDTRFVWETLAADIRRHEESHVRIARNHARDMEQALMGLTNYRGCEAAKRAAEAATARHLEQHDRAQAEFDRIEGVNFEKRILGLLQRRLERSQAR